MPSKHRISHSEFPATKRTTRSTAKRNTIMASASTTTAPALSSTITIPSSQSKLSSSVSSPVQPVSPIPPPKDTSKPLYFWRETDPTTGYLSQWYPSPFRSPPTPTSPGIVYKTAEHYMMHKKSTLFSSPAPLQTAILSAPHPRSVRQLGRNVPNFSDKIWKAERERIVREGNLLKFSAAAGDEGRRLRGLLLGTGGRELVEASPFDRVWGIGFGVGEAERVGRGRWGMNLLGRVLMDVREVLRAEEEGGEIVVGWGRRNGLAGEESEVEEEEVFEGWEMKNGLAEDESEVEGEEEIMEGWGTRNGLAEEESDEKAEEEEIIEGWGTKNGLAEEESGKKTEEDDTHDEESET